MILRWDGSALAVVEVGLGGRLDSTNIIRPILSVITNISLDHMSILGNTLPEIAAEKAGIIKSGVPVVIGEAALPEVRQVFISKAQSVGAPIHFVDEEVSLSSVAEGVGADGLPRQLYQIEGTSLSSPLLGLYQHKNMLTAYLAVRLLRQLHFNISESALSQGFDGVVAQTHLLGRWQRLSTHPLTICDCGHNEAGIRNVVAQLTVTPHKVLRFVYGVMKDKDVDHILPLLPKDAVYYFTCCNSPRAMGAEELCGKAAALGLKGQAFPTVQQALQQAQADAAAQDLVFVGGSCYVVAQVV